MKLEPKGRLYTRNMFPKGLSQRSQDFTSDLDEHEKLGFEEKIHESFESR
jgi:hypothetical protein